MHGNDGTQLLQPLQAIKAVLLIDIAGRLLLACAWQRHALLQIWVRSSREVAQACILSHDVWVCACDCEVIGAAWLTMKSWMLRGCHALKGGRLLSHWRAASREGQMSFLVRAEPTSCCMYDPPLRAAARMGLVIMGGSMRMMEEYGSSEGSFVEYPMVEMMLYEELSLLTRRNGD